MMIFCRASCLIFGLCLNTATACAESDVWTLGVLAHRGAEATEKRWAPTAAYLSEQLNARVVLRACTLGEMAAALERGDMDFVLTNPGHYVDLEYHHGISRIATLKKLRQGQPYTLFGAVIFTRADREDIRTLDELSGKSFAAVSEHAFGGFQMAWRELRQVGIDPFNDLSRLEFTGFPQDDIVLQVQRGGLDAGTVRTGILEQMANEGRIQLNDFRILNPLQSEDFPFRHSTRLYPEWAFAKARATSEGVARAVAVALLRMPGDHPAAVAGNYAGWTVPLDYAPVHDLFRELMIGPYKRSPQWLLMRLWQDYWHLLALAGAAVLLGLLHVIHVERLVVRRTRELLTSKHMLEGEIAEREKIEQHTRTLLQEKRFLAQKCMAVQEEERRNLARELHDELGQCITAIQADAETIQELSQGRDRRLSVSAQAIEDVASRIYGVVHKMMERLRPSTLDQLGLADTLREEIRDWQVRCPDTRYELHIRGDLKLPDERLNISLYRIAQECLTNVAKHARARQVRLSLQIMESAGKGRVELEVEDDGVGMSQPAFSHGLGLIGMRERVEALDGCLDIITAPEAGVRIHISIPLTADSLVDAVTG